MSIEKKVYTLVKEETDAIQNIQQKYQTIAIGLGQNQIENERIKVLFDNNEKSKDTLVLDLNKIKEEEKKLMDDLTKKYGAGSIDLSKGEITVIVDNSEKTNSTPGSN